jgi:hypothetical protein
MDKEFIKFCDKSNMTRAELAFKCGANPRAQNDIALVNSFLRYDIKLVQWLSTIGCRLSMSQAKNIYLYYSANEKYISNAVIKELLKVGYMDNYYINVFFDMKPISDKLAKRIFDNGCVPSNHTAREHYRVYLAYKNNVLDCLNNYLIHDLANIVYLYI